MTRRPPLGRHGLRPSARSAAPGRLGLETKAGRAPGVGAPNGAPISPNKNARTEAEFSATNLSVSAPFTLVRSEQW